MPSEPPPTCAECGDPLEAGGLALCHREDDDRHTCRMVWYCANRHVWWQWADRPTVPLEPCPHPELVGD